MKLVTEYVIKHTWQGLLDMQAQRRKALKDDDMKEYQNLILKAGNWETLSAKVIQGHLYQNLGV